MRTLHSIHNTVSVFSETLRYLQRSKGRGDAIEEIKMEWANEILLRLKVDVEVRGRGTSLSSAILVGNHLSYLDIPLLMAQVPGLSFVAKQELLSWPVFGAAAERIGTVFVKREKGDSRFAARNAVKEAIRAGRKVVIFPSGTTCMFENTPWRRGAFQIAHQTKTHIQPFRISYEPMRLVAYIDRDFFPLHLLNLCRSARIRARVEFHEPVLVSDPVQDCEFWHQWSRGQDYAPEYQVRSSHS